MIRPIVAATLLALPAWAEDSDHPPIPQQAVESLLKNPEKAGGFDQVFGSGQAAKILEANESTPGAAPETRNAAPPPPEGPFTLAGSGRLVWIMDSKTGRIRACENTNLKRALDCSPWTDQ